MNPTIAWAIPADSSSSHYQMSEGQFGSSSAESTCFGKYCATVSIGYATVGDSSGNNYKAKFGKITPDEPSLDVIVEAGQSNLGELSAEKTATKTIIVKVRNYLSDGYSLQIKGSAPKYGNYILHTLSTPTASQTGKEQFGLNVVENTTPQVGQNPVQNPSGQMSFGEAADGYDTPNLFQYKDNDIVALSRQASGETQYTISMIVNISNKTPAGKYSSDLSAVIVSLF